MPNFTRLAAQATIAALKQLLKRLPPGDRSWLARHVVSARYDPGVRALIDFGYGTIRGWKNIESDILANGEDAFLQKLRPFSPRTILDVGANIGDWALAALKHLPEATVHAFEIAPATSAKLVENTRGNDGRLEINRIGLSDAEGDVTLYYTPAADTRSSIVDKAMDLVRAERNASPISELTVPVTTGDRYIYDHGLSRIELLKIDVEGAELSVLNGFQDAFQRGVIDVVQFEYGLGNLKSRIFLEDFYGFFCRYGFVLGKLYPHGVGFKPFASEDEDFIGLNYIACRADREDIVRAIGCPPLSLDIIDV
jgi:FkbM family methyltransferase